MKKVVTGDELKKCVMDAIHMLCDTAKITLGPKGSNVLISSEECSPYITNDGVTIARNIQSEDSVIDAILEVAKEASLKTNELVGDGTTTTLVLLENMMEEGYAVMESSYNELTLRKEMEQAIPILEEKLILEKEETTLEDYLRVASVSANDEGMGKLIFDVFQKVQNKNAIRLIETHNEETKVEFYSGYPLDVSSPYSTDESFSSYLLLVDGDLDSLEEMSLVLNPIWKEKKNLVVLASSFSTEMKEECTAYNLEQVSHIVLLETPEYASRSMQILKDLENFTKATIWEKRLGSELSWEHLGYCKQVDWKKNCVLFSGSSTSEYLEKLQKEIQDCDSAYEQEFLEERYAKLTVGLAMILVGGLSSVSIREKKMRMEDAICALECAKKGVLVGGGLSLLKIKEQIQADTVGMKVILSSLDAPFKQILENAGLKWDPILKEIQNTQYKNVYNVALAIYEDISKTDIKDVYEVVLTSLKNAISISSMLLTTRYLVLNEQEPKGTYDETL